MLTRAWGGSSGGNWTHLHCSAAEEEENKGGRGESDGNTSWSLWAKIRSFPSTQRHQVSPVWVVHLRNVFYRTCLFVEVCSEVKGHDDGDERKDPASSTVVLFLPSLFFQARGASSIPFPAAILSQSWGGNTNQRPHRADGLGHIIKHYI